MPEDVKTAEPAKPTPTRDSEAASSHGAQVVSPTKAAQEIIDRVARQNEGALKGADVKLRQAATEGMELLNDNLGSLAESKKLASDAFTEVHKAAAENYSRSLSSYAEMSKQAMACRTVDDFIALQILAAQKFSENINASTHVYKMMLEGFSKAAKPISDRAEAAAKKYVKEVKA